MDADRARTVPEAAGRGSRPMLRKLLNYIRGRRRVSSSEMNPTEVPQYGETVNYVPCRNCGEGSLQYDGEDDVVRCSVCGEVSDADPPER